MTDPPFSIGLRLEALVLGDPVLPSTGLDGLPRAATREISSAFFAADQLPPAGKADEILRRSFAEHPMINTSRDPGELPAKLSTPQVLVAARVVLLPDFAPIPPGGRFPEVTDDELSDVILVHRRPLAAAGPLWVEDETAAGHDLLQQIVTALPRELWHADA
jgi:hypothetical protein